MKTLLLPLLASLAWLAGCSSLPQPVQVDFAEPKPQPIASTSSGAATPTGSLYSKSTYRPAFEDRRARLIGDTVTILIVENLAASQKSSSTANRTSSIDAEISALPTTAIGSVPIVGAQAESRLTPFVGARVGTSSANDFSGQGGTESKNTFTGSITTTVAEVLPNGHMVVVGEKQIGVNQSVDVLRFSGTIDPRSLQPGSIINSNQVANVRVESKGRGAQHEAQTVGWLSRFFFSFLPF